eukprot:30834-Pelagococcus_subviridis.AAC.2
MMIPLARGHSRPRGEGVAGARDEKKRARKRVDAPRRRNPARTARGARQAISAERERERERTARS